MRVLKLAGAFGAFAAVATAAHADMAVSYYTVQTDGRDFGPVICCFVTNNEVLNTLGPDNLPVYNPAVTGGPVLQDHASNGELLWFTQSTGSATTPTVTHTGSAVISGNSYINGSMFQPNGTGSNDANGFQTAVFSGQFTFATPQTFDFSIGADDDALLFIDGQSVLQLGGIHGNTFLSHTVDLSAGTHTFDLFYADRQETAASLSFSIPDSVIVKPPPSGVPEPATWAMMLSGFGVLGGMMRRRRGLTAAA
jgi:fibro-slime domain-containing protein